MQVDEFLRILDEVHENAWNKRKDPIRLKSILTEDKSFGVDNKGSSVTDITSTQSNYSSPIVYPWPQYFEKEIDQKGKETFVGKYPGNTKSLPTTQGFKFDVWPEIKFIEDYLTTSLIQEEQPIDFDYNNELQNNKTVSFNTSEFPFENRPYSNLGEVSFFYEMFDRSYVLSHYSMLAEQNAQTNEIYSILGDFEINNIQETVKNSPSLSQKLKQFQFNNDTFLEYLRSISNNGQGLNWNVLARDGFATNYLNEIINSINSTSLYTIDLISEGSQTVEGNSNSIEKLETFLESNVSKKLSLLQTSPFTNLEYLKEYCEDGDEINNIEDSNDTSSVYKFLKNKKTLSSFSNEDDSLTKRPLVYFEWFKNINIDSPDQLPNDEFTNQNYESLKNYYQNRKLEKLFLTESFIRYGQEYNDKDYQLTEYQTTSLLNTPYFLNAIVNGVDQEKNGSTNSYIPLGYLFLNSLPFTSLYDKLKTFDDPNTKKENYHFAVLNKFSSIHKLPYLWVLKYGSIWYRYKAQIENGIDILDDIWKNIDQNKLYDPVNSSPVKEYSFSNDYVDENKIVLKNTQVNQNTQTTIHTLNNGFYPQIIESVYYLMSKKSVFNFYSNSELESVIDTKKLNIEKVSGNSIIKNKGYDPNNLNDILSIQNWSSYFDLSENEDFQNVDDMILTIPSCGYFSANQVEAEFFDINGIIKKDILNDKSIYNGSVRSLWGVPNFGFYDNEVIEKPDSNQYLKLKNSVNENVFGLSSSKDEYMDIQDILSVFDKETLDLFEQHFINFCQRKENYKDLVSKFNPDGINFFGNDNQKYELNIFNLLKDIFIIPRPEKGDQQDSNIKNITKKQTESLGKFREHILNYDLVFKNGNSGHFDRRVFNSFSSDFTNHPLDKIEFEKYGTSTLGQETINEFKLRIGDFGNNLERTEEFFQIFDIDFTEDNISTLYKIIQIYISEKNSNNSLTKEQFNNLFNEFLDKQNNFQNLILTHMFVNLNRKLPEVVIEESERNISKLDGNVIKNELYKYFKSMNDRWVAGQDFKSVTIFEDFLFMDKSNLPVGNDIIIDINQFLSIVNDSNNEKPLWSIISIM